MKTGQQIGELMFRHVRRETTLQEESEITTWINASPENMQLYKDLTDSDQILHELAKRWEEEEDLNVQVENYFAYEAEKPKKIHRSFKFYALSTAAVVIFSIGLFYLLMMTDDGSDDPVYQASVMDTRGMKTEYNNGYVVGFLGGRKKRNQEGEPVLVMGDNSKMDKTHYFEFKTLRGKRYNLQFPDGTRIWMNEKSSFRFPGNFSTDSIKVFISGEVYLETGNHQKGNFMIVTDSLQVTTKQATINIQTNGENQSSRITSVAGDLSVVNDSLGRKFPDAFKISSGHQFKLEQGVDDVQAANIPDVLAWRKHSLLKKK